MLDTFIGQLNYKTSVIRQRESDGYWRANDLVDAYNSDSGESRALRNFVNSDSFTGYKKALDLDLEKGLHDIVHTSSSVNIVTTGLNDTRGVWVHEDILLFIAQWLNPSLHVWCNRQITKLMRDKYVILENEFGLAEKEAKTLKYELDKYLNPKYERLVQEYLVRGYHKVNKEVVVESGRIDVITDHKLIEVKDAREWKHAQGQLASYREDLQHKGEWGNRKAVLYLFDRDGWLTLEQLDLIYRKCEAFDMELEIYPPHYPVKKEDEHLSNLKLTEGKLVPIIKFIAKDLNTGEEYKIFDLKEFCKEQKMDYSGAMKVVRGQHSKSKNFTFRYATEELANMTAKERKALAGCVGSIDSAVVCENIETGEYKIVQSIAGFVKQNFIRSAGNIYAALKKTRADAYGYRWYYFKDLSDEVRAGIKPVEYSKSVM